MRIVTWNVNGIRNPFGYQPWRDRRTFEGMFDILEADIVVFQETKIQRKDLRDDMVLVPGWDCYWSLPRHKKGYSGVVVYTRNSTCAPIRAEEGLAGVLCPPNSKTSFRDLPEEEQIGGYPTPGQLSSLDVDAATLDSEGRCVVLEFPAFVLLGVYCPAARDESRDDFRLGFLNLLDARVRNLAKMKKRVILTGDINISREEIDSAAWEESMRKNNMPDMEFCSTPSRRLFNQLLVNGKVIGARDEGRERSVLWDITRAFHESRRGMYTCWETKINARPGNFGSRIDYVLCSKEMRDWFSDSNIQEGLQGSDHCPVYAVFKDEVELDGIKKHTLDIMNPPGMFKDGQRVKEWNPRNLLPMSGKLIQEFDRRQSIRDMFTKRPSIQKENSNIGFEDAEVPATAAKTTLDPPIPFSTSTSNGLAIPKDRTVAAAAAAAASPPKQTLGKRAAKADLGTPALKKTKSTTAPSTTPGKGQQSLAGFFKPKSAPTKILEDAKDTPTIEKEKMNSTSNGDSSATPLPPQSPSSAADNNHFENPSSTQSSPKATRITSDASSTAFIDPIASKESWSSLLRKPSAPLCDHHEPCKTMLTKKPGINCGRSFWMCARPLGPSGQKEQGTQWRCGTFIWASDWTGIEREQREKAKAEMESYEDKK